MLIEATMFINATPERVFQSYADVATWPVWDSEVKSVYLPDGLNEGSIGWLKPRSGPKASISIVHVAVDKAFTVESRLPLCTMTFGHELAQERLGTSATHWAAFVGPLAPLFRRLIGNQIKKTLPTTLRGLKMTCEHA